MCPAIDAVLVYVNKKWTNLTGEDIPLPYRMSDKPGFSVCAFHSHGCFQSVSGQEED